MSKEFNVSKEDIQSCISSSKERIKSAKILFSAKQYRDAVSRAYYAFLDSANALLLARGILARSHRGAIRLFALHYIKTKVVDRKYMRYFNLLMEAREEADFAE